MLVGWGEPEFAPKWRGEIYSVHLHSDLSHRCLRCRRAVGRTAEACRRRIRQTVCELSASSSGMGPHCGVSREGYILAQDCVMLVIFRVRHDRLAKVKDPRSWPHYTARVVGSATGGGRQDIQLKIYLEVCIRSPVRPT